MNPRDILEKFKQKLSASGAPEFEVFLLKESRSEVEVKSQRVHSFETAETLGAALRIVQQGRLGFSFTNDLSGEGMGRAVEGALATARYSDRSDALALPRLAQTLPALQDQDPGFHGIPTEKKIAKAMELERSAQGTDPKVKKVRGASYEGLAYEVFLMNSWGLQFHHERTMNILSLMAVAEDGEEAEAAYEFDFSCFFDRLDPEAVGVRAARKALAYLGGKPGPTLKGPIVLDPLVAGEILEVLAPSFYADTLVKKRSLFQDMEGQKILSHQLTLVDDGCRPGGFASFPFDGEGVPKRKTMVVERGVFKEILSDTEYGHRLGRNSTGASSREGIKRPPQIGTSNFYVQPGDSSFQDLLKKMDRGVFITELIGIHTANPISGDFSVGAQGFLVEKGESAASIKQIALSGNLKEMMNRVEAVGDDLRFFFKTGSPSLLISEMDIAGT
jgi:PmbA protein